VICTFFFVLLKEAFRTCNLNIPVFLFILKYTVGYALAKIKKTSRTTNINTTTFSIISSTTTTFTIYFVFCKATATFSFYYYSIFESLVSDFLKLDGYSSSFFYCDGTS